MKKAIYATVFFSLFLIQSQPVQAGLVLSASGLTVLDTDTGNSWYRYFDDFYFGSTYGAGLGTPTYHLNNDIVGGYDGKTNWGLATVAQVQGLIAEIPLTATGPADITSLFINAPWVRGGGHYNPDWSIGPRWAGVTDTAATDSGGNVIPNFHTILYLDFYKSGTNPQNPLADSYYQVTYQVQGDWTSGPWGSWLVSVGSTPPQNPVPEPTTMLLFGTGLAGLAVVGRRKKKV